MVKTIVFCSDPAGETTTSGSTTYQHISGEILDSTTENNHKYRCRTAGTLSQMYMRVSAISGGTVTCTTRKNGGAGGQSISVTGTGEFEDTSGTDSLDGDDEINYALNTGTAAQTITIRLMSMLFDATTNTVSLMGFQVAGAFTTASTTFFRPITGISGTTNPTENNANCRQRKSGTFKNIGVFVSTNSRTATTFKSRKNDGDGGASVSITASGTGWFEDTSGTDSVVAGDDWNFAWTHGTGTNGCTYQVMKVEFESTSGDGQLVQSILTAAGFVDNTTRHLSLAGALTAGNTAATDVRAETNIAIDFTEMSVLVPTNTATTTSTITLQKNAVDTTLVVSVTADGTGVFTNASTVSFTAAEETSIEITVPTEGGTNTLSIQTISTWTNIVESTAYERSMATETVTVGESLARSFGATRPMSTETVSIGESITRMLEATRNPIETTTITEDLARQLSANRALDTETVTINDGGIVQAVHGFVRTMETEVVTIGENLTRKLDAIRTLPETIIIEDTLTRMLAATRAIATESVEIGENLVRLLAAQRIITDTTEVFDSLARQLDAFRTNIENTNIGESLNRQLEAFRTNIENTSVFDNLARKLEAFRTIGETVSISDLLEHLHQSGNQNYTRTITEDTSISDQLSRMLEAFRTSSDTTVVDESINRTYSASRPIEENISIIDSLERKLDAFRTNIENISIMDSLSLQLSAFRTIVENVGISDSLDRTYNAFRTNIENIAVIDSLDRKLDAFRTLVQTTSISDLLEHLKSSIGNQDFVVNLVENVSISDSIKTLLSPIKIFKKSIGSFASEGVRTVREGRILSPNRWRNSFYTFTHTRKPEHSDNNG